MRRQAYNPGNCLRRIALPASVKYWTLTSLGARLIKMEAMTVNHARYVMIQMVEAAVSTNWFAAILDRIRRWTARARAGMLAFVR